MNIFKTAPFSHEGKDYEIRVYSDSHNMLVKAFHNGKEANGFSHSVTFPVSYDFKQQTGLEPMEVLIEDAKRDIVEKRWEKYLKQWQESH